MVRPSYYIRVPLNESIFDVPINPTKPDSTIQIKREVTVKTLLYYFLAFMLFLFFVTKTFLQHSGFIGFALWIPGFLWLTSLLVSPTKTKLLGANLVSPMAKYTNKSLRNVSTRSGMPAVNFADIAHVKTITDEGLIIYLNNQVAKVYELVGNASLLMFEADRNSILQSVVSFYTNIEPEVNLTYDYALSPQRVYDQMKAKDEQVSRIPLKDKRLANLRKLVQYEQLVMRDYVGNDLRSLHQYLVVKSDNTEDIARFDEWMQNQAGNSAAYLQSYRVLDQDEVYQYLGSVYQLDF